MNFEEFKTRYQKEPVHHYPNQITRKPKVTVIVITYQHAKFIENCLNPILNQETNFDYEILIGEDNSNDGTRDICIRYAEQYPEKIKLLLHKRENNIIILEKPSANFNCIYSMFNASGDYIAFCEGDDYWTDTKKLQKQVDFLEKNPDYSLTYHKWLNYKAESNPPEFIEAQKYALTCTLLFRNIIAEFPVELTEVINLDTAIKFLLKQNGKSHFIEDIKPSVRTLHPEGIWSPLNNSEKIYRLLLLDKALYKVFKETPSGKEIKKRIDISSLKLEIQLLNKKSLLKKIPTIINIIKLCFLKNNLNNFTNRLVGKK